MKLIDSSLRTL